MSNTEQQQLREFILNEKIVGAINDTLLAIVDSNSSIPSMLIKNALNLCTTFNQLNPNEVKALRLDVKTLDEKNQKQFKIIQELHTEISNLKNGIVKEEVTSDE